jgi:hypothetical protein
MRTRKCSDCGKPISHKTGRCRKCFVKSRVGHPVSDETRLKLTNAITGKSLSEEAKQKISNALKGRKFPARDEKIKAFNAIRKERIEQEYAAGLIPVGNNGSNELGTRRVHNGYIAVKVATHKGNKNVMAEHRYLMEQAIGRKLERHEQVHHIDGNKTNNDLSNLVLITASQHNKLNHFIGLINESTDEQRKAILKTLQFRFPDIFN